MVAVVKSISKEEAQKSPSVSESERLPPRFVIVFVMIVGPEKLMLSQLGKPPELFARRVFFMTTSDRKLLPRIAGVSPNNFIPPPLPSGLPTAVLFTIVELVIFKIVSGGSVAKGKSPC